MSDLFGNPIAEEVSESVGPKKRVEPKPNGYAAMPGTGPDGETCKTCAHLARLSYANTYLKCALMRHRWKSSPKTDVRAKSPACAKWEKPQP